MQLLIALGLVVVFPLSGSAQSARQPLLTPLVNGPMVASQPVVDTPNAPLQDDAVRRAFFGGYLRVDAGLVAPNRPAYSRDFSFAGTIGALPEPSNGTYSVADWHPVSASTLAFRGDFAELRGFDIAGGARFSFVVAGVSYSPVGTCPVVGGFRFGSLPVPPGLAALHRRPGGVGSCQASGFPARSGGHCAARSAGRVGRVRRPGHALAVLFVALGPALRVRVPVRDRNRPVAPAGASNRLDYRLPRRG